MFARSPGCPLLVSHVKLTVGLQGNAAPQPMSRPHIRLLQTSDAQYQRIEQPTDASEWFSPHNGMVLAEERICSDTQPIPIRTAPVYDCTAYDADQEIHPYCLPNNVARYTQTKLSDMLSGRNRTQLTPATRAVVHAVADFERSCFLYDMERDRD